MISDKSSPWFWSVSLILLPRRPLHAPYADLTQRQTGHANCFEQLSNSKLWASSLERLRKGEARRGAL